MTTLGRQFILNKESVPSHALIYDGRLLTLEARKQVNITQVLGKRFDYFELMGEVARLA